VLRHEDAFGLVDDRPGSQRSPKVADLVLVLLVTLGAAILGGKAGERFHRKVDRAGASY